MDHILINYSMEALIAKQTKMLYLAVVWGFIIGEEKQSLTNIQHHLSRNEKYGGFLLSCSFWLILGDERTPWLYEPWTHTAAGLVVPRQPDNMPRVLAQGAPAALVPDMAQEEDARLVAWGVRDLQTQRAGWPSPARSWTPAAPKVSNPLRY